MKKSIQAFIDDKTLAVVGASPNKENFGKYLIQEIVKKGYSPIPVNPKYNEVEGIKTVATIKDLPPEVENVIIATPPSLSNEIAEQSTGTHVKWVWLNRGVGKAPSPKR